jgi:hypothetical protein
MAIYYAREIATGGARNNQDLCQGGHDMRTSTALEIALAAGTQ